MLYPSLTTESLEVDEGSEPNQISNPTWLLYMTVACDVTSNIHMEGKGESQTEREKKEKDEFKVLLCIFKKIKYGPRSDKTCLRDF